MCAKWMVYTQALASQNKNSARHPLMTEASTQVSVMSSISSNNQVSRLPAAARVFVVRIIDGNYMDMPTSIIEQQKTCFS